VEVGESGDGGCFHQSTRVGEQKGPNYRVLFLINFKYWKGMKHCTNRPCSLLHGFVRFIYIQKEQSTLAQMVYLLYLSPVTLMGVYETEF